MPVTTPSQGQPFPYPPSISACVLQSRLDSGNRRRAGCCANGHGGGAGAGGPRPRGLRAAGVARRDVAVRAAAAEGHAVAAPGRRRRRRRPDAAAGAHITGRARQGAGVVDHRRRRAGDRRVRHDPRPVPILRDREHDGLLLRALPLRQHPRRRHRAATAQHGLLLPLQRQRVAGALLPDAAGRAALPLCRRRRPRADGVDGVHAEARRRRRLRRAPAPGRPVVRRPRAAPVGLVRPPRGAAGERAALDGDAGQPRGRAPAAAGAAALQGVQRAVAHALRLCRRSRDAVGRQPLLLLRRGRRRRARPHAGLLHRLRRGQRAAPLAPRRPRGAPPPWRRFGAGVRAGACARAVVQQQRVAPGGGRRHAGRHGGAAVRRARRRGVRGPRPRVRAVPARLRREGGPLRARLRHHRRRRQPGGAGRQVHRPAAADLGVPGGQLRPRPPGSGQRHARALDVAPQRRRRTRGRRSGVDQQPRGQPGLQPRQQDVM